MRLPRPTVPILALDVLRIECRLQGFQARPAGRLANIPTTSLLGSGTGFTLYFARICVRTSIIGWSSHFWRSLFWVLRTYTLWQIPSFTWVPLTLWSLR